MKKAFTLAETMITLVVIGIIAAIVVPVAIQSKPDENIMKFKKANDTLYQTISTLLNSDKYYLNGNLGIKPNGDYVDTNRDLDDAMYFCKTFAENINYKKLDCHPYNYTSNSDFYTGGACLNDYTTFSGFKGAADTLCEKAQTQNKIKAEIVLSDGVEMYQGSSRYSFGINTSNSATVTHPADWDGLLYLHKYSARGYYDETSVDGYRCIKLFCIDVDGFNGPEKPFGYLIRADGKIITGPRVDSWLEKSIQSEK